MNLVVSMGWLVRLVAFGFVLGIVLGMWVVLEGRPAERPPVVCDGAVVAGRCVPAVPVPGSTVVPSADRAAH